MKAWKVAVIVGMVAVLAVGAGVVFAQGEDPNPLGDEVNPCGPRGRLGGHRDGDESFQGPPDGREGAEGARGELHELMKSAIAEALGMSVEEFEAALETEKGPMGVAIAQGLSEDEARALFEEAHNAAIQEALEQGLIDEDQAERMLEHGLRGPGGRGPRPDGDTPGDRGRRGPSGPTG